MSLSMKPIMFVGTGSDVGKSILATALCRILKQDGYNPAPFKAQNMALNSYVTKDGLEMGRAQVVQAEAACLEPHVDMNPLLLKPNSEHTTQVILNGRPIGNRSAYSYFRREGRDVLRQAVCDAFDRLSTNFNPIVMEGAGSISELNLRDTDIVNMSMARYAEANVILVADIDRGGVFASVYGSIMLQQPEDRKLIKGIIVNKFRGDLRLFDEGRGMLEEICGVPVLGVVPMMQDLQIEAEDSMELAEKPGKSDCNQSDSMKVQVAVVLLRHISNFTDFDTLERDTRVNLFYTSDAEELKHADVIIIPGTKNTLDDLLELRKKGLAQAIVSAHKEGATVVGICGGYQILGFTVSDPVGVEGSVPMLPGLGLLPVNTVMDAEKTTCQVEFDFHGEKCRGYEIHQGVTTMHETGETADTIVEYEGIFGTYVHGVLDNAAVIDYLLSRHTKQRAVVEDIRDFRNRQYDMLAEHVRRYVDIEKLYSL